MGRIFISYRRDDSAYPAAILFAHLERHFGTGSVFMDIDNIPLGTDFRKHIADALADCEVVLAVIGDQWLSLADSKDRRRIDGPDDFVRMEIEGALARGVPLVPVQVGRATIPDPNDLPESIQELAFRHASEVRAGTHLQSHLDMLVRRLERLLLSASTQKQVITAPGSSLNDSKRESDRGAYRPTLMPEDHLKPPVPREFVPVTAKDGQARFRARNEPIGNLHSGSFLPEATVPVCMESGSCMWLRVMPRWQLDEPLANSDLRSVLIADGHLVKPLNGRDQEPVFKGCRGHDGYGIVVSADDKLAAMVVYAFESGEIWSIDTSNLRFDQARIYFDHKQFSRALQEFGSALTKLGVAGPYRWIAGIEGVQGRRLQPEGRHTSFPPPECLKDSIVRQGDYSGDPRDAEGSIEKFVAAVYDAGGLRWSRER